MTEADPIQRALALPNGARFYKCALQVNQDTPEMMLQEYPFLEPEDVQACLLFAQRQLSKGSLYDPAG